MKYNESNKNNKNSRWRIIKIDLGRRLKLVDNPELALPRRHDVVLPEGKYSQYLFGGTNLDGKAKGGNFTRLLGIDGTNYDLLRSEIKYKATVYPAIKQLAYQYGQRYTQHMILYGVTRRPANVTVGWIDANNETRLTTMFIEEAKE